MSLFFPKTAIVEIADTFALQTTDAGSLKAVTDVLGRETKIEKDIVHLTKLSEALTDPSAYLTKKKTALEKILKDLAPTYYMEVGEYVRKGLSYKEAEKKGLELINFMKEKKLEIHELDYPTDIVNKAIKKKMH
jgi:FAD synthase